VRSTVKSAHFIFIDRPQNEPTPVPGVCLEIPAGKVWGFSIAEHGMTNWFAADGSNAAIRRWWAPVIALVVLAALPAAPPADGAPRKARPAQVSEATASRAAGEAIMAIVSIKSQQVTIYDADGWILRAPVSTGQKGHETPAGVFAVVEKKKDHRSNMYDDAWMPNMLRVTWNGIALHGGPLPGHPASKGCVRLPFSFADKLFDKIQIGTRVIFTPNDAEPVEFSHPALFAPNPKVLAAAPALAEKLTREADEAARIAKQAKNDAAAAKRVTASLTASLRKLEQLNARAKAELAAAEKRLAAVKTDQGKAQAEVQQQKASARAAELQTQLDAAKADAQPKLDAAAAAPGNLKAAEARRAETAKAAREAKLALEPVSVFISRATRKIYIRRNTHERLPDGGERFDAIELPITIRNPDQPIGTHVITAVARTDGGLRWTAVTIDGANNAKDALDRITIPQEVIDRFAPTASPRSSFVISDEPPHSETNYRTEFVVALSRQPQGGLITRPRTPPDVLIARDGGGYGGGFFDGLFRQGGPQPNNTRQRGQPYDQRQGGGFFYR
jgi:lipoprotein-anchoring transpeptidase ErfK/SrfK